MGLKIDLEGSFTLSLAEPFKEDYFAGGRYRLPFQETPEPKTLLNIEFNATPE